jgi:hypothetical protein
MLNSPRNSSRTLMMGDSVSSCALKISHGVSHGYKAMGVTLAYSTPIRELDQAVTTQNVRTTLRKDEHLPELPHQSTEVLKSCGDANPNGLLHSVYSCEN